MNRTIANARVFLVLLRRDLKMLRKNVRGLLIDNLIVLFTELIYCALFPLMGMPVDFVGPLFLGSNIFLLFFLGYSLTMRVIFDMEYKRFIDYQLTLPLPKKWLFTEYIVYFMIESAVLVLMVMCLGIILLGSHFVIVSMSIPLFILTFLLILAYMGSLFLALSFLYTFKWLNANAWPRRLSPLLAFSSTFLVWKVVYAFSLFWGTVFLINPITHLAEGLRATLIGGANYFSPFIYIVTISSFLSINIWLLSVGIKRRLDPV